MTIENIETRVEIFPISTSHKEKFLNRAYDHLCDMESYSDYMEDVINVEVKPHSANESLVNWETKVEDAEFSWKQINHYDKKSRSVSFKLVEGDFDMLEGEWQIMEDMSKYFLRLKLQYNIGLPVIEDVLGPILKEKMKTNSLNMLTSLKTRLEEGNDAE